MATSKITLHYKAIEGGKFKGSIRYAIQDPETQTSLLSDKINLQICSGRDKTRPRFILKQKLFKSWSAKGVDLHKCFLSDNHFVGDLEERTHFVLCELSDDFETLRIVIYPNYYPYSKNMDRAVVGVRTSFEY